MRGRCGVSGRASSGGGWCIGYASSSVRCKGKFSCFGYSQLADNPKSRSLNGFSRPRVFRVLNFEKIQNTLSAICRPKSKMIVMAHLAHAR